MAETSNVLRVNIVTPDGLVYDHHAKMLVVHSVAGELGIMANHEPIVTPLEIGEVDVQRVDSSDHNDSIAVNGGFMEVSDNVASIVADSAERERDIDLSRAMKITKMIYGGRKSHYDGQSTGSTLKPVTSQ